MFPQKRHVNVAAAAKRKFDMSHAHITTTDFGRMKPIELRYMVPGDEFNYNINSQTRVLNTMPSPTFGKFDVVLRSFFVPIHNIWTPFYDYLKNQPTLTPTGHVDVTYPPYCTPADFCDMFTNSSYGLTEQVTGQVEEGMYDFQVSAPSPEISRYYKFTRLGRLAYDFITSSGLNIPLDRRDSKTKINLLPLIAFWKAYFDWVVPSRFIPEHEDYIQILIEKVSHQGIDHLTSAFLHDYLIREPLAYFIDDAFTTSTLFPFQSEDNLQEDIYLNNPASGYFDVQAVQTPADIRNGSSAIEDSYSVFNMWTLQTLGKLQDYLNRGLIAGTKVQDWLLSEFGLRPSSDALHLSEYLGSKRSVLDISSVLSTADTLSADGSSGVPLGAYGGYIKDAASFDFSYKAKEHGYFIITQELVPRAAYYQGLTPEFDMIDRFDFFQPEFDNQQGSPIPFRSLYFDSKNINGQNRPDARFGFGLQYELLKQATDVKSGDFRNRFGLNLKSWFLTRDMDYLKESSLNVNGICEDFCLVKSQWQDWHYIFSDMTDQLDPFLCVFYFNTLAMRPMKSVTEGFEPEYKNGNKDVSLDFSGSVK